MVSEKKITLENCLYSYAISDNIKRYTFRDTTFSQNRIGGYELTCLLGKVSNSGDGFPLKITINRDLIGFKLSITDKSDLRFVNIFKPEDNKILQEKLYFLMDSLVERDIFTKKRVQ